MPFYPAAAWTAHFGGSVEIEITVDQGVVVDARVKHGKIEAAAPGETEAMRGNEPTLLPYLAVPSVENVKTWRFQPEARTTFLVTYVYKIEGTETLQPENPRVELDLPRFVRVTTRPFKPTTTACNVHRVAPV
jgi:hypothetical protein